MISAIFSAALGTVISSLFACVPGLHVYNLLALLVLGAQALSAAGDPLPPDVLTAFIGGMVVGFAFFNTLPSILLAAPDESAVFTVLPGQKFLMQGRGRAACMITIAGSVGGMLALLAVAPLAPRVLPVAYRVLRPHTHWILWCVIAFMLMSEWPKGGNRGRTRWARLLDGWRSTGVGLLTFLLSGLLGFVLMNRSPIAARSAFQNLMPAFVGLFTMPWLIVNAFSAVELPPQHADGYRLPLRSLLGGVVAGSFGGGFAAFFPVVTGGVGGMLAGHATAIRDDDTFLVSQGASKLVYYVGAYLLLFVPQLWITRGGAAWMLRCLHRPRTGHDYAVAIVAVVVAGIVALALARPLIAAMLRLLRRVHYRRISLYAFALAILLVYALTGWAGLLVLAVASGIGLLPVLYGSRRMNCLGVILLPIACNMSGCGADIATFLGLLP